MPQDKSYQTLSTELDEILERLQSPDIDIDEAMKLYAKGQKLVEELEKYLKTAKNQVKISKGN